MDRKGIIVYSFEDLKKLQPKTGKLGTWAFHANCHAGHIRCAEAAQHCDWVVGMMHNNMAEVERWMTGTTLLGTFPATQTDIDILKKYSDVCFILTGDYNPHKEHWESIKNEFGEIVPFTTGFTEKEFNNIFKNINLTKKYNEQAKCFK